MIANMYSIGKFVGMPFINQDLGLLWGIKRSTRRDPCLQNGHNVETYVHTRKCMRRPPQWDLNG